MSQTLLRSLQDERNTKIAEMRSTLDAAEARDGGMTAEDDATIVNIEADIAALDQRMSSVASAIARMGDVDASVRSALDAQTVTTAEDAPLTDDDKLRALGRGELRSLVFGHNKRDLLAGTATDGKETVPTGFYGSLVEHLVASSGVLQAKPTVLETGSGEPLVVPVTTSYSSGALVAEAAAIGESDPQFAARTLSAYKYGVLVQVSTELLADTGINLTDFISRQAGTAIGNAYGVHLVTGDGSSKPQGVATAASAGVTAALTADSLIDLFYSVLSGYRASSSCGWVTSDTNMATMRKLKDGANQYLWSPAAGPGTVDTFLGKPVYSDPNVATHAAAAKSVLFGDFATYFVRLAGGIRVERSDDFAFANDLVTFRVLLRGDGQQADQTGAIKALVGS